ncbi:hypothetical protein NJG16_10650 [Stenotrophomonas maltophilia]|nr:hypothetical protein [Stenotrophomonas maltophilia]
MDIEFRNSILVGVSALEAITFVLLKHAKSSIPNLEQEVLDALKAATPNGDPATVAAVEQRIRQYLAQG